MPRSRTRTIGLVLVVIAVVLAAILLSLRWFEREPAPGAGTAPPEAGENLAQ